jgi:hypothetical protein
VCYQLPLFSVCVFIVHGSSEYEKLLQVFADWGRGMRCHLVQNILSSRLLSNSVTLWDVQNYKFACCYGCEIWSFTLREEYRLRMFKNRVLQIIFGPKRVEVTGDWRKLHNKQLHDLYCSPNIIWVTKSRRMRWAGQVAHMAVWGGACRVWQGSLRDDTTWKTQA